MMSCSKIWLIPYNGINFKASKYFDIPINSWKLDKLKINIKAHN